MSLALVGKILFVAFLCGAVLSWFLISRVARALERVGGPPELIKSLDALAFSGEGGPSYWPGHGFVMRREYLQYNDPGLTKAGNRALCVICFAYLVAAAMVVEMILDSTGRF
jgi:hypothetical protein